MAASLQESMSLRSYKADMTVSQCVHGLLSFASTALPLFIYATIPTGNGLDDIIATREELLGITASLHMIQTHLPLNLNVAISNIPLVTESLVQSLARCVLLYAEIEAFLSLAYVPQGERIRQRILETFKKSKMRNVGPELEKINSVLSVVADIVACYDIDEAERLEQVVSERTHAMLEKGQALKIKAENLATDSAHVEPASILDAAVPICFSENINHVWYTSSAPVGPTTNNSLLVDLAEAAKISWELPWPNTLRENSKNLQPSDITQQRSRSGDSVKSRAKAHAEIEAYLEREKYSQEQRQILVLGNRGPARAFIDHINLCYGSLRSAGPRKECCSEVFNYLASELELAARKTARGGFENLENSAYALYICAQARITPGEAVPRTCLPSFINLWADAKVKVALRSHHGGRVFGNLVHFYKDITRIFLNSYVPTKADMHHLNSSKTRPSEHVLDINSTVYRILDGNSPFGCCRRIWGRHMQDMTAILYVVDLDEYDLDTGDHQLPYLISYDMLSFDSLLNSVNSQHAEMLLFFTNVDRFRDKIEAGEHPIRKTFPQYEGDDFDADRGMDFFTDFFLRLNQDPERVCSVEYTHERDTRILHKLHRCVDIALSQRGPPPAE